MGNINSVVLSGRLGVKPEIKTTKNDKSFCWLSIATSEYYNDDNHTTWHRAKVYGARAESCAKWLDKGQEVDVVGRLTTEQWEKDGQKNYVTYVIADKVNFGSRPGRKEGSGEGSF